MRSVIERILGEAGPDGDPGEAQVAADWCLEHGEIELEAAMLDRAFGLDPTQAALARRRAEVLDRLALVEHGIEWRYVPEGSFRMGSPDGDPDERPVLQVRLRAFRIASVPVSWTAYAAAMGWPEPPDLPGLDEGTEPPPHLEDISFLARIWHGYSEERPPGQERGLGRWDTKPLVAVGPVHAEALAERLSERSAPARYALPSEAQWEKAARGGLVGARYPWGDDPPTPARCDAAHFGRFELAPSRALPPNGYGLYAMCGGVWEWTRTPYDALAYRNAKPEARPDSEHVIRGGSFADCAAAVTVSFRASRSEERLAVPNLGFRLCRRDT